MKKSFLALVSCISILLLSSFTLSANRVNDDGTAVNQKVLKSFYSVFDGATNVLWSERNNHFFVSFNQDDVTVRAEYDKNGALLSSLRYYGEQHLPLNILCKVKKDYPTKNIDVVTEVTVPEGMAYIIQLQDKTGWTILQSDINGELTLKDQFSKPQ